MKASRIVYARGSTIYLNGVLNNVSKIPANVHLDSPVLVKIMFIMFRSYQICEQNCTKQKSPLI